MLPAVRAVPPAASQPADLLPSGGHLSVLVLWLTSSRGGGRDLWAQSGVQGIAPTWALPVGPLASGVTEGSDSISV